MKNYFTGRRPATWLLSLLGLLAAWPAPLLAQTKSAKRGLGYGYHSAVDMRALAPGLSWWYNWAQSPDAGVVSVYQGLGMDFVPMQWDERLNNTTVTADALAARIPAGAKYLLGFNEPNFLSQANLTPKQAAALWPVLEDVGRRKGLKLVSPAVNYCGDCVQEDGVTYYSPTQYLDAFFAAYPTAQVDYIAVHTYVCEEKYLREKIGELKKYGKPIWLTEFSCGDMPAAGITLDVQKKYLTDAVNYLENEPAIFRYAWFSGRNNEIPNINLLGGDGQLTALGQLYVNQPYAGSSMLANRLTPVDASASSSEKTTVEPTYAIDGDINSRWASAWSDAQYFQLDFGTTQTINHVRISWEGAYAADYQLQTSDNGTTWSAPIHTVLNGDGGVDDITGLSGRGRYLRIACSRRGTTYGYSIYEVNAYGAAATTTPTATLLQAESYSSMSGVGVETTRDTDGGHNVGWIGPSDNMTYNGVKFPTTGAYTIEYRVASPNGGSLATDLSSGSIALATVPVPATGGWQTWRTVSQTVNLTAGTYNLRVRSVTGGWNFNWLRITPVPVASATTTTAAVARSSTPIPADAGRTLEVYPNPATDQLQLRSSLSLAGSRYQILNALGQTVADGAAEAGSLNVTGLKPGVYTLLLIAEGQRLSRRFVK